MGKGRRKPKRNIAPAAAAGVAAAAPVDPQPCTIGCLPDHLLGRILALAGKEHGRSLTLVSRCWHRLFFAEAEMWRSYKVKAYRRTESNAGKHVRRLERQAAVLRRLAPCLQHLCWHQGNQTDAIANGGLARCLLALRNGQMAELELHDAVPSLANTDVCAALRQLTSLTSLTMRGCPKWMPSRLRPPGSSPPSPAPVYAELTPTALDSLVQLTQLTSLALSAQRWPVLSPLTRLSQLKQLALHDNTSLSQRIGARMQPPGPAEFPGLERFSFESNWRPFQIDGCELRTFRLWRGSTASIPSSRTLPVELPLLTLTLSCSSSASLAQLLSALQPPGATLHPLQRLAVFGWQPVLADLSAFAQLRHIEELVTHGHGPHCLEALEELLLQATGLCSLALHCFGPQQLRGVPACVVGYSGLARLELSCQCLSDLPAGRYLAGLETLDLSWNQLTRLPAAISTATRLTSLSLEHNANLALGPDDAEVLLALPRLRQLRIGAIAAADPGLLHELRARLPNLAIVPAPTDEPA